MVVISKKAERYFSSNRALHTSKTRVPWRHRTRQKKPGVQAQTPAEKLARAQKRTERNALVKTKLDDALLVVWKQAETLFEQLGTHSVKYWYEKLLQQSTKTRGKRKTSRWNAFLSQQTRQMNEALPPDATRLKVHERVPQLKEMWKNMTRQEQEEATAESINRIADVKEMKRTATHSNWMTSFHDVRATLASIEAVLEELHHRTGLEMFFIAVRSDTQALSCPQVWTTGDQVEEFFQLTNRVSISDFAGKLESFCLSGIQSVANSSETELASLKKRTSKLIFDKLVDAARPDKVGKMLYVDFDRHITERFGIVIEHWPLDDFVAPGSINSRIHLQLLYNSWLNDKTYFRRMSKLEFDQWQKSRFENHAAAAKGAPSPATVGGSSSNVDAPSPSLQPSVDTSVASPSATPAFSEAAPASTDTAAQFNVFNLNGDQPLVTKPPKKRRADAGRKRGPNKRTKDKLAAAAATSTQSAA